MKLNTSLGSPQINAATASGTHGSRKARASGRIGSGSKLWARWLLWARIARERRQLGELSNAQLRDIGIDRVQAMRESGKPWYDVPLRRR